MGVDDVYDEVHDNQNDRVYNDDTHDQGIVTVEGALDKELAQAWHTENLLNNNRAGDDTCKCGTEIADDREHCPFHGMLENNGGALHALGFGRADIVASERLQHG
ncbi:hypothetical protein DSECCO2_618710 [anaerobic digester metagenome]